MGRRCKRCRVEGREILKREFIPQKVRSRKKTKGIARLLNVKEEGNNMSFPKSDTESKVKKKLNNNVHLRRTAKIRIEKDQAANKYSLRISGRGSEIISSEECNSRLPH